MRKQSLPLKLSLKKTIVHSLKRAEAAQLLGGDDNTSRQAPAPATKTILPVSGTVQPQPQPVPKPVQAFLEDDGPVCTGR